MNTFVEHTMVGTARCAVPVAEHSVRRRNQTPRTRAAPILQCVWLAMFPVMIAFATGVLRAAEDERPVVDASKVAVEHAANAALPTFHIVGDSTVRSGGAGVGLWGWGERIAPFFDTNKLNVINHAIGGRSARTYVTEGRWDKVAADIKPGDFIECFTVEEVQRTL